MDGAEPVRDRFAESLVANATHARAIAASTCAADPVRPGERCAWYHGFYPVLRVLGLAATPDRHGAFFDAALARQAPRHPRVLVTGAADTAMLARVARAYATAGTTASVHLVDRCPTPLALCARFAAAAQVPLGPEAVDVRDLAGPEAWDLICTHSFLAQFAPADRDAIVARWRAVLAPGGVVVTTTRLASDPTAAPVRADPEAVAAFRDRVLAAVARHDAAAALGMTSEECGDAAERWAARTVTFPLAESELRALLDRHGFALEHLAIVEIAAGTASGAAVAGTARAATYAEVVARRR